MPKNERERRGGVMRWFCGVPVLANPIILIDLFTAVVIIWFVSVLLVVGAQALLGDGPLLGAHIAAACVWATYVAAAMPLMYAVICLLFFRRGYVILYRLEENGLFMETMRGSSLSDGGVFAVRPFPVPDQSSPARSVTKDVSWADVKAVRELREMRALQLRGRFGALATVYCPDRAVYEQALEFIRKKAALS
jgi:hypothetical protein